MFVKSTYIVKLRLWRDKFQVVNIFCVLVTSSFLPNICHKQPKRRADLLMMRGWGNQQRSCNQNRFQNKTPEPLLEAVPFVTKWKRFWKRNRTAFEEPVLLPFLVYTHKAQKLGDIKKSQIFRSPIRRNPRVLNLEIELAMEQYFLFLSKRGRSRRGLQKNSGQEVNLSYPKMTTTSSANITNELILEEIKKSKQELKASIEAVEVKVLLKIEEVNRRINSLEQKNKNLEDKLENIERTQRKNNIIIFGMQNVQECAIMANNNNSHSFPHRSLRGPKGLLFGVIIGFLVKLGKTVTEAYAMLKEVYGDECLSRTQVLEWFKRFEEGRETTEEIRAPDGPQSQKRTKTLKKL
ncbi:hypothetical protein NQ318_006473, partial [Aromia moschata]